MPLQVLAENENWIVVVKPHGVPAQPDKTGDMDMTGLILSYLEEKGERGGVFVVHRLDRPVGGVMVYAKNKETAAWLSAQEMEKRYLAVLCGEAEAREGELRHFLLKNERKNLSAVVPKGAKQAKEAVLYYRILETARDEADGSLALAEIQLKTGRHHQIRVQFRQEGLPLWGDVKYNPAFAKGRGPVQTALYAYSLSFYDPVSKRREQARAWPAVFPFSLFSIQEEA